MPRNGSGVYSLPAGYAATSGNTATATQHNTPLEDLKDDANAVRPVVAGGTGGATAAAARTALGVAIGSDVQAYDAGLQSISGLTPTADQMLYATGSNVYATTALTSFARTLLDDADAGTMRATLGLVIGTDVQAHSAVLDATTASFLTAQETKLGHISVTQAVDLDQMETDIAALANGMVYKGDWDASAGTFPGGGSAQTGWFYYVSVAGTVDGVAFAIGDNLVATTDNASTATYASNWSKHDQTDAVQAVVGLTGSISKAALLSALNVEDGADVTDTTNVTAAGALMDSELTDIAAVKALDQGVATADTPEFAGLGLGTSSPDTPLDVIENYDTVANILANGTYAAKFTGESTGDTGRAQGILLGAFNGVTRGAAILGEAQGTGNSHAMIFATSAAGATPVEHMRLTSGGRLLVGKTVSGGGTAGAELRESGLAILAVDSAQPLTLNRHTNDGELAKFQQDGTQEGSVSVSGTTVSYNGAHLSRWSQLPGIDPKNIKERQEILRGSVLSNLDEMILWRGVAFDVPVLLEPAVAAQEAVEPVPEHIEEREVEGETVKVLVPAVPGRDAVEAKAEVWGAETKTVAYSGDKADGEKEIVEFEGETYEGVIYTEDNEQLNKMQVSNVKGDRDVAGVFQDWDDDDDEYLNDFYCAMTGDFVIRIAKGCAVQRGDLLMSAGDGTACPQEGELADVVRSCTVAKVTSKSVTHTFDDGSYLVPCVLMAC